MELQENQPRATAVSRSAAKRPLAVTFVALLVLVVGAYHIVDGVFVVVGGGDTSKLAGGAFELAFGVLAIAIGSGALRMRRWAWVAFMTLGRGRADAAAPARTSSTTIRTTWPRP